ncbi:MAG: CoxG family protein [Casimicrobiaceae bacterium]
MDMKGSRVVPADVETTWRALNDPDVLRACIPGCESIERVLAEEYRVAMTMRVGPVSAKFAGRLVLADLVPQRSYTLQFEGQGGAAGFANGTARVALAPVDAGTQIDYAVNAQIGGKLAQIGSRLVDGAAAKVADDFFARFVAHVGARTPPAAQGTPVPTAERPAALRAMRFRLLLAALVIAAIAIYWWLQAR